MENSFFAICLFCIELYLEIKLYFSISGMLVKIIKVYRK